ncbi:MAG: DMT family transporter [Rhodobacteraceae bacterium]|nr:DMT family transporter [Paracoccaceae bacterium]
MSGRASWPPVIFAGLAAAVWGVWWVPIRWLESSGLHGPWAGLVMNCGAFLAAALWLAVRGIRLHLSARALAGAALVGVAVSTYSTALNYTDVIRAVLLFYLAPVWSKIIEWAFLGLPWRRISTVALVAALLGAYLVLGAEMSFGALNFGDMVALVSGVSWAVGAALVFTASAVSAYSLTTVSVFFAVLVSLPLAIAAGPPGVGDGLTLAVPTGMAIGAVYVLPTMVLTLWAAQRLAPATLTLLLTAEILTGVISSAVLLAEPFGWMQAAGAVLIVLAAVAEVLSGMGMDQTKDH